MSKQEISQLRSLVFEALKSTKIYMDFGGDTTNLQVLAAFFKWPDIILALLDLMDEKDGALAQCVSDIGYVMLQPLKVILGALLERYQITNKEQYEEILSAPVNNEDMADILKTRKAYLDALTQITKEVASENRNSGDSQ
jgi:hypothetical protein